jgi:hypothetical protein
MYILFLPRVGQYLQFQCNKPVKKGGCDKIDTIKICREFLYDTIKECVQTRSNHRTNWFFFITR